MKARSSRCASDRSVDEGHEAVARLRGLCLLLGMETLREHQLLLEYRAALLDAAGETSDRVIRANSRAIDQRYIHLLAASRVLKAEAEAATRGQLRDLLTELPLMRKALRQSRRPRPT